MTYYQQKETGFKNNVYSQFTCTTKTMKKWKITSIDEVVETLKLLYIAKNV